MLKLYIDISNQQLIVGLNSPGLVDPQSLPFFFGDTLPLEIRLLSPSAAGNAAAATSYDIVPTTGKQLKVFITDGDSDEQIYANQLAFDTDPNQEVFSGNLALNTVALQALIGTNSQAEAWLVIGYLELGLPRTVYAQQILVKVGMPNELVQVPAGETPISAETAAATFIPKKPVNGQPIYLASAEGDIFCLRVVRNADGKPEFQASQEN